MVCVAGNVHQTACDQHRWLQAVLPVDPPQMERFYGCTFVDVFQLCDAVGTALWILYVDDDVYGVSVSGASVCGR